MNSTVGINQQISPTSITFTTTCATGIGVPTGLPSGVIASWGALDDTGGRITLTGVPSQAGVFLYRIPLTGGYGDVSAMGALTVLVNTVTPIFGVNSTLGINREISPTSITFTTTHATGIGVPTDLPSGVIASWDSLDDTGGRITLTGAPSQAGVFFYRIPLTGGYGDVSARGALTVLINTATTTSCINSTVWINQEISPITFTTTHATGIGIPIGLPPGVTASWDSLGTITLTGTPSQTGDFFYHVPLTGGYGDVSVTGTLTVSSKSVDISIVIMLSVVGVVVVLILVAFILLYVKKRKLEQ